VDAVYYPRLINNGTTFIFTPNPFYKLGPAVSAATAAAT
jgi:hypothetical protein